MGSLVDCLPAPVITRRLHWMRTSHTSHAGSETATPQLHGGCIFYSLRAQIAVLYPSFEQRWGVHADTEFDPPFPSSSSPPDADQPKPGIYTRRSA